MKRRLLSKSLVENHSQHLGDFNLCHDCLEGKAEGKAMAITRLQKEFGPVTTSYLKGAGASLYEAIEVVDSLWADLIHPAGGRQPRLSRYDGSCALQTWLNTVALNELLSIKRRQQRWDKLMPARVEEQPADWHADPGASEAVEAPLIEIMQTAVETAFLSCEPEDFVLLQLKHCDGLRGAELGLMFGCDESVISRRIDKAQSHIASMTLWKVRQTDPWLELKWTDFVDLCRTATPACFGLD